MRQQFFASVNGRSGDPTSAHTGGVISPQRRTGPWSRAVAVPTDVADAEAVQELGLDGLDDVAVCTVLPASIDTPFFRHAANYTGRVVQPMVPVPDPRAVARAVVSVARRPRREVAVGAMSRSMVLGHRLAPGPLEAIMARQVDASHLSDEHTATDTAGNLHRSSPDPGTAAVSGGWAGRRRTARRRVLGAGLLLSGPLAVRRLLRREPGFRSQRTL